MKKEPLSLIVIKTLLAVIIFTGVGTIIVGGGWLIGNYEKISKPIKSTQQQLIEGKVTITTDKTEYEQGEMVKIGVNNNSGENVCFESCNTYYFQKKNVIWKEYLTKRCEVNFITKCIDHSEVEEFKGRLSEVDFKEGVYKIAVPIYTDCQNEEFPCKENKTIYSNEFTIKEK